MPQTYSPFSSVSGPQIRAGLKLPLSLSCTRIEFSFPHISSGVTGQDAVLLYVYFSLVNFFFHIIFSVLYPEPLLMEIQHLVTYSLWWVEELKNDINDLVVLAF